MFWGRLHQPSVPTARRKIASANTRQLVHQLEAAVQRSIYKRYATIYHASELTRFLASQVHPAETLRHHLFGVVNGLLFLVRARLDALFSASAALAGDPGGNSGPVEMDDPRDITEP